MDENTKSQRGSPSRDLFKLKHKTLAANLWSLDIDFMFVEKLPYPDIVAAVDFKNGAGDSITFAEVIAYTALLNRGIPVYIVSGDPEVGAFSIFKYNGGCHKKPTTKLELLGTTVSWKEFEAWEQRLRKGRQGRFSS